jgi:hypothetical protein
MTTSPIADAIDLLEHQTGVVIPVYFRPDADPDFGLQLLRDTVGMFVREVASPQTICLSVDGPGPAAAIARQLVAEYHVQMVAGDANRGKLAAVASAMSALLQNPALRYFFAVDQDGDHFANELLSFIRAAEHAVAATGSRKLLILGNRLSRHRPLGFLRAEQEELANRMLMDALAYDAAVSGAPLVLQYLTAHAALPDFHSGYKCFSRAAAEDVFLAQPNLAGCSADAYYRHACEAVMAVEAYKAGALLAAVNRSTFDEQPISVFASLSRTALAADMIVWPCKRLQIPPRFVAQWLDNHLPGLLLGALAPQGRDELLAIRRQVRAAFALPADESSGDAIHRPRFI